MLLPVAECPSDLGGECLGPPAVQLGEIDASIDEHLHPARPAGLPRPARRVDPDVHSLHQALGQQHVVIAEEYGVCADIGSTDELHPFPDQRLTGLIRRVGFARHDELDRAGRIGQQTEQPIAVVQEQVGSFVGGEAARKTQCQRPGIEKMRRRGDLRGRRAGCGQLSTQLRPRVLDQRGARRGAEMPQAGVGDPSDTLFQCVRFPEPSVLPAGLRPEIVGLGRVPAGHVDPVGHVADRNLGFRPFREERREETPAHFPVQSTHTVHCPAAADGQIRHGELFRSVCRIHAAESQEIAEGKPELLLRIPSEVLVDEGRIETVEACRHRRVRREEIARPRGGQGDLERLTGLGHESASAFQDGEGSVPFVQVTDFRSDPQRGEQPPAADAQEDFLLETQLQSSAVQLAGDTAMHGDVCRVVAVQEVELCPPDLHLPRAQPDRVSGQLDLQSEPFAVLKAQRGDRKLAGIVVGVERLLCPVFVDGLPEIALLVQQSHPDDRHSQVAGCLQLIPGDVAETSRIDRQRLAHHELHAEIGDGSQAGLRILVLEPGGRLVRPSPGLHEGIHQAAESRIGEGAPEAVFRDRLQESPGVVRELPLDGIEGSPHLVGAVVP